MEFKGTEDDVPSHQESLHPGAVSRLRRNSAVGALASIDDCVAQHGGLSYINQYACGCKLDKIAEKLSFNDFEAAKTFSYLKSMAGDNGGMARDPKQSKDLRKQLKEAEDFAEKSCFVK